MDDRAIDLRCPYCGGLLTVDEMNAEIQCGAIGAECQGAWTYAGEAVLDPDGALVV